MIAGKNSTGWPLAAVEGIPMASDARLKLLQNEPIVLTLSHVTKSYKLKGANDAVHALIDINLSKGAADLEEDNSDDLSGSDSANAFVKMHNSQSSPHAVQLSTKSDANSGDTNQVNQSEQVASSAAPQRISTNYDATIKPFGPVHKGEFLMICGPSGGGKTTLLNCIGLIDFCTSGVVNIDGKIITKHTSESELASIRLRKIGFVFQTFNLIPTMTAAENVELPMTLLGKLSRKDIRLRSRQLLTLVGLRNRVNHLPSELSGGEQQRVTIARSLANNPSILLLDEPTGDLDTLNTIDVMDLLTHINRLTKTTFIMVTHNNDVECYADRVLYVADGRFVREVRNEIPMKLDYDRYTQYIKKKESNIMADDAELYNLTLGFH